MDIIKDSRPVKFKKICPGQVFQFNAAFYIKVTGNCKEVQAVNLKDGGKLWGINGEDKYYMPACHLTISD